MDPITITQDLIRIPSFVKMVDRGGKKVPKQFRVNEIKVADRVFSFISKNTDLNIKDIKIVHDYGSWLTPKSSLKDFLQIVQRNNASIKFLNLETSGFIDIQLAWSAFGNPNAVCFGPGLLGQSHTKNEYVLTSDIIKTTSIYSEFFEKFA